MQLRQLDVSNVRSYESAHVEFGPGTTLLVGDVGAGKTSLLYAIEMALFGAAEVDAEYLVRHGAGHAQVAVRFEDADHAYDLSRRLRRVRRRGRVSFEPEKITFREDGVATSYSATEVRQRVIELLGFPDNPNPQSHSDLWRWAVYVPQERMRDILSAKPQERLETVRRALGVERYRTAYDNAQLLAADLRTGARHAREEANRLAHWDSEFDDATRAADRLRSERAELERAIAERASVREAATARRASLEKRAQELEADRREADSLAGEEAADERGVAERRRVRDERVEELTRRTREAEEARRESLDLAAVRHRSEVADRELRDAREALARSDEDLRALAVARAEAAAAQRRAAEEIALVERSRNDRDAAAAETDKAMAEGPSREPLAPTPLDLPQIERSLAEARERERGAVEGVAGARGTLSRVEELLHAGVCPTCGQTVRPAEFARHQAEAAERLARAEATRAAAATAIDDLETTRRSRERFERAHERWAAVDARRTTARETLERREEAVRSLESAHRDSLARAEASRRDVERLKPVEEEAGRRRKAVEELEAEAARRREAVERGTVADERARSAAAAVVAITAEIDRLATELSATEGRRRDRTRRIAVLREKLAEGGSAAAELAAADAALAAASARENDDREALVRAETRLDGERRRAALAERGRSERADRLARAIELEAKAEWAGGPFRIHLLAMERDVLAHAQATFDREFARFFASLVDDPGLVARTAPDFTPEVAIDGEPTPAEALSGGERTSLALAFRLALASIVRSLGAVRLETLILDEPTDGFSSEQMVRLGELFEELGLPQVILVSHESQLASIADRSLRVVKTNGRSSVAADGADRGSPTVPGAEPSGPTRATSPSPPAR